MKDGWKENCSSSCNYGRSEIGTQQLSLQGMSLQDVFSGDYKPPQGSGGDFNENNQYQSLKIN